MRLLVASFALFIAGLAIPSDCAAQNFVDESGQVTITKSGLVLNRATNTFNSLVTITNSSGAVLNAPLVLVISNISPSTVTLANPSGKSPSGNPFVSLTVPADGLLVGSHIANVLLEFSDPTRVAFTFTVSVSSIAIQPEALPDYISGPLIESVPPTAALVGQALSYQVIASSANPASLVFSLSTAPQGMTINATTGLLQWTPGSNQGGDQSVVIAAQDSGGQTSQSFTLSVFGTVPVTTLTIPATSGGTITVNDPGSPINGLSITFPAGALASDTTFTVSQLISPPTLGGTQHFFMAGFAISPDGIPLASPATVKLPYDPSQFAASQGIALEGFLGAYFIQGSTGKLQSLHTVSVDKINHVLTATVPHFSVLEFANIARLCPPPITGSLCGDTYAPDKLSLLMPAVMVHGFVPPILNGGMGTEGTWGNLRTLLSQLDSGQEGRIGGWRFDWDSFGTSFEDSAGNLDTALAYIESVQPIPTVNIVAHSFGGILSRTYLAGLGTGQATYGYDVNRIMTLGTPHTGIGGNLSTILASACAAQAQYDPFSVTCFEAGSGQQALPGGAAHEGDFLRHLNSLPLPGPPGGLGAAAPWFMHIKGQTLNLLPPPTSLHADDGLITIAGATLCGGSPVDVCSGASVQDTEVLATSASDPFGLCHSGALLGITCSFSPAGPLAPNPNVGMVAVNDTTHPLWSTICGFLGCKPAINVTVLDPAASGATVTSDVQGINCGSTCTGLFASGSTVTLTANAGSSPFSGWSGACSGTSTQCVLTMDDDHLKSGYSVTANFGDAGITFTDASCTGIWQQQPFGILLPYSYSIDGNHFSNPAISVVFPPDSYYYHYTFNFSGTVFGPPSTLFELEFDFFLATQISLSNPGETEPLSFTASPDGHLYYPNFFDTNSGVSGPVAAAWGSYLNPITGNSNPTTWTGGASITGYSSGPPPDAFGTSVGISWQQLGPVPNFLSANKTVTCTATILPPS